MKTPIQKVVSHQTVAALLQTSPLHSWAFDPNLNLVSDDKSLEKLLGLRLVWIFNHSFTVRVLVEVNWLRSPCTRFLYLDLNLLQSTVIALWAIRENHTILSYYPPECSLLLWERIIRCNGGIHFGIRDMSSPDRVIAVGALLGFHRPNWHITFLYRPHTVTSSSAMCASPLPSFRRPLS